MERGFQSLLLTGKYELSDDNFPPVTPSDDSHIKTETTSHTHSHENIQISNKYTNHNLKRLKTVPATTSFTFFPTNMFNQLPELRSIEQNQHQHMLESPLTNYFTPALPQPQQPPLPPPATLSNAEKSRLRRKKISDKTRSLHKLLPVEKKMDIATIYEEAYKYITFLKAQISVLESMPVLCCSSSLNLRSGNPRYGGLGKLNRQQLLQVLVNSPSTQSVLYSNGYCVYSLEQLMLFNDVVQKRFFVSDR